VRWHSRFQLGLRDIQELLFEREVTVSYETIRRWREKICVGVVRRAKTARRKPGARGTSTRCSSPCMVRLYQRQPNAVACSLSDGAL